MKSIAAHYANDMAAIIHCITCGVESIADELFVDVSIENSGNIDVYPTM